MGTQAFVRETDVGCLLEPSAAVRGIRKGFLLKRLWYVMRLGVTNSCLQTDQAGTVQTLKTVQQHVAEI